MPVDWSSKDVQKWLETCRKRQEEYYQFFGQHSWIKYKPTEYDFLKRNIGFALFGGPSELNESDELKGYNEKQRNIINKMFHLIRGTKKEHLDQANIWVSFLYVCCRINENHVEVPIIRVPKKDVTSVTNSNMFIDSSLRVYENWDDFLNNNKLPACLMCYPREGKYHRYLNELLLDKGISPEGKIGFKVLKGVDITTTVIQFATVGVGVAAIFVPMAWPVLAGIAGVNLATGGYTAGRSIAQLRDRDVHQQSIGLDNAESRNCYLGIVGSAFGIASGGAVAAAAKAVQTGESIALASQIVIRSLTGTSCALNSLGVVNGIANIVQKVKEGEEVTGLDIYHVTSSVLFFTSSVISTYQANVLINNMSKNNTSILSEISNFTNKTVRSMTGIGEIIHVENFPQTVGLGCFGVMTPPWAEKPFFIVCKNICKELFKIAQLLWQKIIRLGEYKEKVGLYFKMLWNSWNDEINMVIEKICNHFGVDYLSSVAKGSCKYLAGENPDFFKQLAKEIINAQKVFLKHVRTSRNSQGDDTRKVTQTATLSNGSNLNDSQITNSSNITENDNEMDVQVAEKYRDSVIEIGKKFADEQNCQSPQDFIKYLKFTCKYIRSEFIKQKQNYEKMLNITLKFSPGVTVKEFDVEYGIQTSRNQYFLEQIMKDLKNGTGFSLLRIVYERESIVDIAEEADETDIPLHEDGSFRAIAFENKVGLAPDGWLNRDQYFRIAENLAEEEVNETNTAFEEEAGIGVMFIREAEKIINVTSQKQDDSNIFGIALMFDHSN